MSTNSTPAIFPLHLGGNISWWVYALAEQNIQLDVQEYFVKQSYHNRMHILSANGLLALTAPTSGGNFHRPLHEIKLNFSHNLMFKNRMALQSAYGSSPYYEHYDYLLEPVLFNEYVFLHELSFALIQWLNKQLKLSIEVSKTESYIPHTDMGDYRKIFDAKKRSEHLISLSRYPQTFEHRYGFVPDLSILDLLFNMGPASTDYLLKHLALVHR
jgi:hypothetical protein